MASPVDAHHVLAKNAFDEFEERIDIISNGQFKLDAVYNLRPLLATAPSSDSPVPGVLTHGTGQNLINNQRRLCCTNRLLVGLALSPDGFILWPL